MFEARPACARGKSEVVLYRVREYTDRSEMNVCLPRASEKERVGASKECLPRRKKPPFTPSVYHDQDMRRREEKTREGEADGVILCATRSYGTALSGMKMKLASASEG